jgi:hypothetical protein
VNCLKFYVVIGVNSRGSVRIGLGRKLDFLVTIKRRKIISCLLVFIVFRSWISQNQHVVKFFLSHCTSSPIHMHQGAVKVFFLFVLSVKEPLFACVMRNSCHVICILVILCSVLLLDLPNALSYSFALHCCFPSLMHNDCVMKILSCLYSDQNYFAVSSNTLWLNWEHGGKEIGRHSLCLYMWKGLHLTTQSIALRLC